MSEKREIEEIFSKSLRAGHKIYLYKEDFINFKENLEEVTNYIFEQKGEDIITNDEKKSKKTSEQSSSSDFTEVNLDEIDNTEDS